MQKRTPKKAELNEVPEVIEFLDAEDAVKAFREEHAEVFEQMAQLVDRYNTALQQADKACRGKEVTCGPFVLKHFATKYDAEKLFHAIGRDKFLQMGGKLDTQTVYDVDRGRLEACIAQNQLAKEVIDLVRKETPNYTEPKPLVVP
jgi:hypothetical protein